MNMSDWANNEVELLAKTVGENEDSGYLISCARSALKAFQSLMGDGHSGMSIGITKSLLMKLIDQVPLTPIEDVPEVWEGSVTDMGEYVTYQCARRSSLFKDVYPDGSVVYKDLERICCVTGRVTHYFGFAARIAEQYLPEITFPYSPELKPFKVHMEDFLYNPANGDLDTIALYYIEAPDGSRIRIDRYFTESGKGFTEISELEYEKMKKEVRERV